MESINIGIIIQRQDGKILLNNDNYYIESKIDSKDDIYIIIESILVKEIGIKLFKIRREYSEINQYINDNPFQKENNINKMFLVEVCIYNEYYNFVTKEEIYDILYNCPQKFFFEKYIIRYFKYKEFIQCIFTSTLIILTTVIIVGDIGIGFNKNFIKILIILLIVAVAIFYLILIPKLATRILDYIINDNILKYSNISSLTIGLISIVIIFIRK